MKSVFNKIYNNLCWKRNVIIICLIIFTISLYYICNNNMFLNTYWRNFFLEISKMIIRRMMVRPYLYDYNCNEFPPPLPLLISLLHTNFHKISALIFSSVMMSFNLLLVVLLVNFRRLATFPLRHFRTS